MVISCMQGGLGNQMFQYATGRALALRLGVELKLDISWFSRAEGCAPRQYLLNKTFSLVPVIATARECAQLIWRRESFFSRVLRRIRHTPRLHAATCIREPHFSYWPDFSQLAAPAILLGYWQNEKYFENVEDTIRRDFTFPAIMEQSRIMAERICATPNSVAVHIRRGDYVSNTATNQFHGVCSPAYYKAALDALATRVDRFELFLFSDDPAWVRKQFDCKGIPATVIDFPEHVDAPWHDMHLMSLCHHHIIANSSFSWWGAWLANKGGNVYAPRRWFVAKNKLDDNPSCDRWILL